jgi:hypothetical protein
MEKYLNIYKGFYAVPTGHSKRMHKPKPGCGTRSPAIRLVLFFQDRYLVCRANLKGFASHIHVLYREVPHILCITHLPANCASLEGVASIGGHRIE